MYQFGIRLDSFGRIPEPAAAALVAYFVEALAHVDEVYLAAHPDTLPLYVSGVRYVRDTRGDTYSDLPLVYAAGRGDCEDLVAIRLAELWQDGENARALVELQEYAGGIEYHLLIAREDGSQEDPSELLGMKER